MNWLKRGLLYVSRNRGKSLLLFIIIFLLGSFMSGAISIFGAINVTTENLWRKVSPVVYIRPNLDLIAPKVEEWAEEQGFYGLVLENEFSLNPEMWDLFEQTASEELRDLVTPPLTLYHFNELRYLPYIGFSTHILFSGILMPGFSSNAHFELMLLQHRLENPYATRTAAVAPDALPANLRLQGTAEEDVLQVKTGTIDLVSGRTFTEKEVSQSSDIIPIILPSLFANENNLRIGETFLFEQSVFFLQGNDWDPSFYDNEDNVFKNQKLEFEIIGLADVPIDNLLRASQEEIMRLATLLEVAFIPNWAVARIDGFYRYRWDMMIYMLENDMELVGMWEDIAKGKLYRRQNQLEREFLPYEEQLGEVFFLLNHINDFESFHEASASILPPNWTVSLREGGFDHIAPTLETLENIAHWVLLGSLGTTLIVLTLSINLFLKDRRFELGAYLAMGVKKLSVAKQILLETALVSLIGLLLAIGVGHIISGQITQEMVLRGVTEAANEYQVHGNMVWGFDPLEQLGMTTRVMGADELLEAFDVSLSAQTVIWFVGAGLGVVLLSSGFSIIYVWRLKPKELLL